MVCFDDFDVVTLIEDFCSQLKDFERCIHAHAHIRCEYHADMLGGLRNLSFACGVKAGGADDQIDFVCHAFGQIGQCGFRTCEINHAVRTDNRLIKISGDVHAGILSDKLTRVTA